jgi:AraC-like DNA-binding protein
MICKRILPGPELRNYIREYLTIHLVFENKSVPPPAKAYPVHPEEGIRFIVRGTLSSEDPETGIIEKRPTTSIFGQPANRQNLLISHEFLLIHVRFQPGMLYKLLEIPMTEIVNQNYDASLILGRDINEVQEQLAALDSYDAMFEILDNYFIQKVKQFQNNIQPVDKIGFMIFNNPQGFNLEKTAGNACLSFRQFEKRFAQQVGLTPKYFARVCRFYQAYELKELRPNLDWLSVAVRTGYNDYQHLVKDFKQFAGVTPNVLIWETLNNPERSVKMASDFIL